MSPTYVVTGSDTGIPRLPNDSVIAGLKKGDTFTTTLDAGVEAELIGAGLIAKSPLTSPVRMLSDGTLQAEDGRTFSGGGTPGTARVLKFPFAYNTAGLLTGHTVYTPAIGDVLLDGFIEIDTAWNGTTPRGDFGSFAEGYTSGWLGQLNFGLDMANADAAANLLDASLLTQGLTGAYNTRNFVPSSLLSAWIGAFYADTGTPQNHFPAARVLPAKFVNADPIKVCVSQDGTTTGADPGSTQGAAVLYLVVATPA